MNSTLPTTEGAIRHLTPGASMDVWREEAGMNWSILERPTYYRKPGGGYARVPNRKTLVRDDTMEPLSIVSARYKTVQPGAILESIRNTVGELDLPLDSAGVMGGGVRLWASAKLPQEDAIVVMGKADRVEGRILISTACDGAFATRVAYHTFRPYCTNMLPLSVGSLVEALRTGDEDPMAGDYENRGGMWIPHFKTFDPAKIAQSIKAFSTAWTDFMRQAAEMADRKVTDQDAIDYFLRVFYTEGERETLNTSRSNTKLQRVLEVFHNGVGQDLPSAKGTLWGCVNATTRFLDHEARARSNEARLQNGWFGYGLDTKKLAWKEALEVIRN